MQLNVVFFKIHNSPKPQNLHSFLLSLEPIFIVFKDTNLSQKQHDLGNKQIFFHNAI